jgi:hypothetical protein
MSFAAESWAWDQSCGDGIAKSVLAYLAFRADRNTGEAWPAMGTIVRAVEHGERAVRKAVAKLVKAGKVERLRRFAANGRCTSTLYRLPVTSAPAVESAALPTPADSQETPPLPTPANSQEEPLSKEESNQEKEERGAPASPPPPSLPPSPAEIVVEGSKEARRIEEELPEAPEDPEPEPELKQLAVEAGQDPAEVPEELRDCASGRRKVPADWQPSAEDRACALEHGQDPDLLRDRFVLHYRAAGRKLTDWSAKFQQWCLPDPRYPRRQTLDEKNAATHGHYAAMAQRFGMLRGDGLSLGGQP